MIAEAWKVAKQTATTPKANKALYRHFQERYIADLPGFISECFYWPTGQHMTAYQAEICGEISKCQRVSVRGPHGLGKTAMMAWIVLWFALTRDGKDWKAVTTASAWRQLQKYLWPEIHKWSRLLRWDKIGREPFGQMELRYLGLRLETGEAFAVASDNPALIEGAHAEHILYIFDESKSIIDRTFDAAEGALSTPGAIAIAMSTPGEPHGRFYDIQSRKKGYSDWWTRAVKKKEVIDAGRMTQKWADDRREQWGEQSAVYLNRVEGEFAASDEDSVIPLAWIERANERWKATEESKHWGSFTLVSGDIARTGEDKTVLALRYENAIRELRRFSKEDTMETTGRIAAILTANNGRAVIDVTGLGAGVFDRLHEQGFEVSAFVAAGGTRFVDRTGEFGFVNVRSAALWNLREMLEDDIIALPPDDTLTGDLTAPKWRIMSGARIAVESKDDIKKRISRSTDDGDAVAMAFWDSMKSTEYGENPLFGYRG